MPDITHGTEILLLALALGYLIGSIPFGLLLARAMKLGNLRDIGSGNIGATNVLRTGNKRAAALTLLLDAGKGAAAVLIARALWAEDAAQLAGLGAFLGHLYPVWLRFRGGKGVATFLGILLALNFWVGVACCATWLATALILRMSSLAALMAAGMSPLWMLFLNDGRILLLALALTVLIYVRHWGNIRRIKAGTEPKIGA